MEEVNQLAQSHTVSGGARISAQAVHPQSVSY